MQGHATRTTLVCWVQSLHQGCWLVYDPAMPLLLRPIWMPPCIGMAGKLQGARKPVQRQSPNIAAAAPACVPCMIQAFLHAAGSMRCFTQTASAVSR